VRSITDFDVHSVAHALGGEARGNLVHCPGPNHSRQDRSLTVWVEPDAPDGFRVHSHAGDDPLICRDYIRAVLGMAPWRAGAYSKPNRPVPVPRRDRADKEGIELAQYLWRQRQPLKGSIAENYLRVARHYGGPIPGTLGFLPASRNHLPAMIAAFAIAQETSPGDFAVPAQAVRAVHLTKLKPDGSGKADVPAPKKMLGRGASGLPIMLAAPNDRLGLAITEGIEDGLSIHEATGLGVWAAGSASRMPALAASVPAYIESVTIIGDNDIAGAQAANSLAQRLADKGIAANVKFLNSKVR
jgi:hypothetical protein